MIRMSGNSVNRKTLSIIDHKKANLDYSVFCLYHNNIFANFYRKKDLDKIVFVKTDTSNFVFECKNHIYAHHMEGFVEMGEDYAECEFMYNLYNLHINKQLYLPEYLGFIHYDMEIYRNSLSIFDFFESVKLNNLISIYFQPAMFSSLYNQNYFVNNKNCMDLLKEITNFKNPKADDVLGLCFSFFIHRDVFIKMMSEISLVINHNKQNPLIYGFCSKRNTAYFLERYASFVLKSFNLTELNFHLKHYFLTGSKKI